MIGLHLEQRVISVPAGDGGTLDATVVNHGTTVDEIALDVVGGAAAWSTVVPARVRLFPGDRAQVHVRFQPALSPTIASGTYDFGLRARSTTDPSASVVEEGTVRLGAAAMISAQLIPRLARGRARARQRLHLTNVGNTDAVVSVTAADPDDQLRVRHDARPFELAAGASRQLTLISWPASRTGVQGVPLPLTVTVTPEGGSPAVLEGRVAFGPFVAPWLRKTAGAAGVVAALVAGFLVLRAPSTPVSSASDATVGQFVTTSTVTSSGPATTGTGETTVVGADTTNPSTPGPTTKPPATKTTTANDPPPSGGPATTAGGNQVSDTGALPWTIAAGGSDGSVWLLHSDGSSAKNVVPGGTGIDPSPAWSPDRTELAFVSVQGGSTTIALAPASATGGPGQALPHLICLTCDNDPPPETDPPPPTTRATVATTTTTGLPSTTTTGLPSTTTRPTTATTTVDEPVFLAPDALAWAERTCAGSQCTDSVVFGDPSLHEQSRVRLGGPVAAMVADADQRAVIVLANDRAVIVRAGSSPADVGGPFNGVSVDRHGHTIGWHGRRDGEATTLEDTNDHHTVSTGTAGTINALTWSVDGSELAYVSGGHLFVARADFSGARDVTPAGLTVASVA